MDYGKIVEMVAAVWDLPESHVKTERLTREKNQQHLDSIHEKLGDEVSPSKQNRNMKEGTISTSKIRC